MFACVLLPKHFWWTCTDVIYNILYRIRIQPIVKFVRFRPKAISMIRFYLCFFHIEPFEQTFVEFVSIIIQLLLLLLWAIRKLTGNIHFQILGPFFALQSAQEFCRHVQFNVLRCAIKRNMNGNLRCVNMIQGQHEH